MGSELAVVDICGRVSILFMSTALNGFNVTRMPTVDQEDDLGGVVGMFWLNLDLHVDVALFAVSPG